MEITLLAAVSACYHYNDRERGLLYEIRFGDSCHKVKFGKRWDKLLRRFTYFVEESFYPRVICEENNFVGILAACRGVKILGDEYTYSVRRAIA